MKKINSKTKKSDLISVLVDMGVITQSEAETKTNADLYALYQKEKSNVEKISDVSDKNTTPEVNEDNSNKVVSIKKRLPKKSKNEETKNVSTTLGEKLESVQLATGETKEQILSKIGMSEQDFESTKDIKLGDEPNTEVVTPITTEENIPQENEEVTNNEETNVSNSNENDGTNENQTKDAIIDQIVAMSETIKKLEIERTNAIKDVSIVKKEIHQIQFDFCNAYRNIAKITNAIALTKDTRMCAYYDMLRDIIKSFKRCDNFDQIEIIDMHKLILEDIERDNKLKQIEKQNKAIADAQLKESHTYAEGVHINYIDGELVKVKGIRANIFKEYKAWVDDCREWVDYVVEEMTTINSNKIIKNRIKPTNALKNELKKWYITWEVDDEILDMVKDTMENLINDLDTEKAMSDFVAIVDSLDL